MISSFARSPRAIDCAQIRARGCGSAASGYNRLRRSTWTSGSLAHWRWGQRPPLDLGGTRQRALLAILLIHRGTVVPADRLIDDLYGSQPPPTAAKSLQAHVSRLRKALGGDGRLVTRGAATSSTWPRTSSISTGSRRSSTMDAARSLLPSPSKPGLRSRRHLPSGVDRRSRTSATRTSHRTRSAASTSSRTPRTSSCSKHA